MGYSINKYPYTGSNDFDLNFTLGYISRSDVFVYVEGEVDGTGDQILREFDWLNDNRIRVIGTLVTGNTVVIRRVVRKQGLVVDFSNAGSGGRENLNIGFKQTLMAMHELFDGLYQDVAEVPPLPQDIANGLKFVSDNSEAILVVAQTDATMLDTIADAYLDIEVALQAAEDAKQAAGGYSVAAEQSAEDAAGAASAAVATEQATEVIRQETEYLKDQALAGFDNFQDKYLGAFSSAPVGSSGELYFDTTLESLMVFTTVWEYVYVDGRKVMHELYPAVHGVSIDTVNLLYSKNGETDEYDYWFVLPVGCTLKLNNLGYATLELPEVSYGN